MDVLDNNNNIPFTPFDTHTHTSWTFSLTPSRLFQHKGAWNLILYEKGAQPFSFFFESNETEHITSNQYTDGREREREKNPLFDLILFQLSPHVAAEPSWAGRKSMVTPFFFCRPPLAFHLFFLLRISSSSSSHLLLCAQRAAMQPYKSRFSSTPSTCRSRKTPHEKLMWVENECRNNRAA